MTKRATLAIFLFLVASMLGSTASAIDETQIIDPAGTEVEEAQSDDRMGEIFTTKSNSVGLVVTVLGYIVILGGLGVAIWLLFKRGFFRKSLGKSAGKLNVTETRMLGNRQFIMVVEYEEQKILLGVGPGKIDYLTSLNSPANSVFPQIEQEQEAGGRA